MQNMGVMGAKLVNTQDRIQRFFNEAFGVIRKEILTAFSKLGEECTVRIRDRSAEESWIDHTSNLRSSIGYAIYDYGIKLIESTFATLGSGAEGSSEGKKMVKELASEYSKVFALVVIAAMNYADFVEAKENKDVLASTELWARSVVDGKLKLAVEKAVSRINQIKL